MFNFSLSASGRGTLCDGLVYNQRQVFFGQVDFGFGDVLTVI